MHNPALRFYKSRLRARKSDKIAQNLWGYSWPSTDLTDSMATMFGRRLPKHCKRHQIKFDTEGGPVAFIGRDTRRGDCPIIPRPAPTTSQECAADVFRRAVNFCTRTSRSRLQQKLCVGRATRMIASAARCKETA